jgi:uridine kinase
MKYIAIDGPGGSGKTYLANRLAERLHAEVFHLDDFGNDYEPFIGIPKLVEAIAASIAPVVIFEGVGVFDARFDRFDPFRVFVNTSLIVRRERAALRDVPRSDRSAEEWKKIYEIWRVAEADYFTDGLKDRADLVTPETGEDDADGIIARMLKRQH